jgi:hypothetical protein
MRSWIPHHWLARVALGVVGLAILLAVAGFAVAALTTGSKSPSVSLLDQPATADDALPTSIRSLPAASDFSSATDARLAVTRGAERAYVIPGKDSTFCLAVTDPSSEIAAAGSCADQDLLKGGTIFLSFPQPDGTIDVIGLVADSYTRASSGAASADVVNNVFALSGLGGTSVTLLDKEGQETPVDLGPQEPTTTVQVGS